MTALARIQLVAGWLAALLGGVALWLRFYARIDCPAGDPIFGKYCLSWVEAPTRATFPPVTLADLNLSIAVLICILLSVVAGVTVASLGTSRRLHGAGLLLWLGVVALFLVTPASLIVGGPMARFPVGDVPPLLRGMQNMLLPARALTTLAAVLASIRWLAPMAALAGRSAAQGTRERNDAG